MGQKDKKSVAQWLKEGRAAKGYTQQELSDLTGISLRSVQRIENGEVMPRQYSLRLLADKLALPVPPSPPSIPSFPAAQSTARGHARKIIITVGLGLLLILGTLAFLAQSPHFPETDFEGILLWMVVAGVYFWVLYKIWNDPS